MDKSEAQKILSEQLARYRGRSHSKLVALVESEHVETCEVRTASGTSYQVEIQFFWDNQPGDAIRVAGGIDDGGIRAFVPLTDDLPVARTSSLSV